MDAFFLGIIFLVLFAFAATYKYALPRKGTIILLVLLVFSLAGFGAFTEPKIIYDLSRHYDLLSAIKNSTFDFKGYLLYGPELLNWNYKYTYIFNILCYVIARYLPFQFLPFITILVSYSCLLYVLVDYFELNNLSNRNVLLSIALCQVTMPYLFVYSGIRNALASAIIGFGIYRFFFKKHNYFELALLTVCSVLIHPIGFVIIPFIAVSKITPGFKGLAVPFVLPSLVFFVTEYCRLKLGNDFLFKIADKYYNYTQVRVDNQGISFFLCSVGVLVILSAYSIYHVVKKKTVSYNEKTTQMMNMLTWYSLFSLGYFTSYEMLTRLPYNFAILSPVIVASYFKKSDKRTVYSLFGPVFIIGLFLLSLYETVMWLK